MLEQLTTDHTLAEELRRIGHITPQQVASHLMRSVVTRALGVNLHPAPDLIRADLAPGDVLLLCTDGLVKGCELVDAAEAGIFDDRLGATLERLVVAAGERGGDDAAAVAARMGAG